MIRSMIKLQIFFTVNYLNVNIEITTESITLFLEDKDIWTVASLKLARLTISKESFLNHVRKSISPREYFANAHALKTYTSNSYTI